MSPLTPGSQSGEDGSASDLVWHFCRLCPKRYRTKVSLVKHSWQHKGHTQCSLCHRTLATTYHLRRHLATVHLLGQTQVRQLAPRRLPHFENPATQRLVEQADQRPVEPQPTVSPAQQRTVSPAQQRTVSPAPQPTVSPAPEQPANPAGSLRPRQRTSKKHAKPYLCRLCPKQYRTKFSLTQHQHRHEGRTRCQLCDRVTDRLADLRRHMTTVHQMTAEEVFRAVPDRRYK